MSTAPRAPDHPPAERPPVTLRRLAEMKQAGEPIVMVTAYDHPSATVAEEAGVDVVLVGDSAANTVLGYESTVPVSMDEMLMLARAVRRGLRTPLMVGDLPFGSYQESRKQAIKSAARFVKEAGCDAVKIEMAGTSGGPVDKRDSIDRARAIIGAGIPVMGHVGLTPQSAAALGGYRAQGRTAGQAVQVADDALALQDAGCFAIVFEAIPAAVTETIMEQMTVPVIGIGAGPATDGQVLVFHDLLGINEGHTARFVKRYSEVKREMVEGVKRYAADVRAGAYPTEEHCYGIDPDELEQFRDVVSPGKAWDVADFMS
jgi:3-methyl-2-oxobutanoate hydroxymethyltransferase